MGILSRWRLVVIGGLLIALGTLYWLYQDRVDAFADLAVRSGEYVKTVQQLETQQQRIVETIQARDDLRGRVEELERARRRELEDIHAELERLRGSNTAADRWASEPVPDSLRLRADPPEAGDDDPAAGVSGADRHPVMPGAGVAGREQRRTLEDGTGVSGDAPEL